MTLVPANRLIVLAGAVLFPAALALAYVPGSPWMVSAAALLLALAVAVDGLRVYGSLDSIGVTIPGVVRMTRGMDSAIDVTLEQPVAGARILQLGLALHETVRSAQDALFIRMPDDAPKAVVSWPCTPGERGNFRIERVYLGGVSPWGLWEHRRAVAVDGTLRVYPNMQRERKNLAAIFLNRGVQGMHAQRYVGKGREFEQLREYVPGDSFEDIHWKATARRGKPITKMFQVERTREVYVLIDSSRLSALTLDDPTSGLRATNLERCINAALVLGLVAQKQGDLFGLITFDEKVNHFLKARNGRAHYSACRDAIYAVESSDQHADFAELFSFIRLNLRKRALLIILTNLSDPLLAESFTENVDLVARNHLILVNMIADPRARPIFSDRPVDSMAEIYARMGGHFEWRNLQMTRQTLHLRNVSMQFLDHDSLSADIVSQYMAQKQRQLL